MASGEPQATVLDLLLFILHNIGDLPKEVSDRSRVRLFACECLLYRPIHKDEEQTALQTDRAALEQWSINYKVGHAIHCKEA